MGKIEDIGGGARDGRSHGERLKQRNQCDSSGGGSVSRLSRPGSRYRVRVYVSGRNKHVFM
jgi:hypothetical protein